MNKQEKSLCLWEQMSGIDEEILHECSALYPVSRRKRKVRARILILAAALMLAFTVMITGAAAAVIKVSDAIGKNYAEQGEHTEPEAPMPIEFASEAEIREVLFSGEPAVITREADGGYEARFLTREEYDGAALEARRPAAVYARGEGAESERVWISDGRGRVFSPYLRYAPGNVGYGGIFEYEPEVEPSEALLRLIRNA